MTRKEQFITEVEDLINSALSCQEMIFEGLSKEALEYFEEFKLSKENAQTKAIVGVTEKGKPILKYMQNNHESFGNRFRSKDIAEGLFVSPRSVTGSLRKLSTDNYIKKLTEDGVSPIIYAITSKGLEEDLTN